MYTFAYSFHPWTDQHDIANGDVIMNYLNEVLQEFDIMKNIQFGIKVSKIVWDTERKLWQVEINCSEGESKIYTCKVIHMCTGYYRYSDGYTPCIDGIDNFKGDIIHPQKWPVDYDYSNKNIVVIGSGATAITLIPILAEKAACVTMLQRSPSYIIPAPSVNAHAVTMFNKLPPKMAYFWMRWKSILYGLYFYWACRRYPEGTKRLIKKMTADLLVGNTSSTKDSERAEGGEGSEDNKGASAWTEDDVTAHFSPRYLPWDQRLCLDSDAKFLTALRDPSKAIIVTDEIDHITSTGIRLVHSGKELSADVIVTATGLEMQAMGGIEVWVGDKRVHLSEQCVYKGCMLSGIPNLVWTIGYTNNSFTLKSELASQFLCRLVRYMDWNGLSSARPEFPPPPGQETPRQSLWPRLLGRGKASLPKMPLFELSSSYMARGKSSYPMRSTCYPWRYHNNYLVDLAILRYMPVYDCDIAFE